MFSERSKLRGIRPVEIESLIQEDSELLLHFKALVPTTKGKSDVTKSKPTASGKYGNSKDYLLSRLKQVDPGLISEIGKGKQFSSLTAAAIYAGIVKPKQRLEIRENPEEMAKQILSKCGKDYAEALASALNKEFLQGKQKAR